MLTPQEVNTHAFNKAVMGGYNMTMVDEFLDEVTDDYTALYKENTALKAKMKVLVEKVEEYRATEDSMRATLLTAQRMADSIVKEAEEKRDALMAQAEQEARSRLSQIQKDVAESEARLREGQLELARFAAAAKAALSKELAFLDELPELTVDVPAPVEEDHTAEEIEARVMSVCGAAAAEEKEPAAEPELQEAQPEEDDYPEGDPFAREPVADEPTRRINLSELKFGRNYSGDDRD